MARDFRTTWPCRPPGPWKTLDKHSGQMATKRAAARAVAKPRGNNGFWLDHAEIVDEDYEWLASVERLTLWNVRIPDAFLARLDKLWWLDIRGGSAVDLEVARGTTKLQYLAVNQVRGMCDLSIVGELASLRYVALYGLPHMRRLPSFSALSKLERASLGQMRGLLSLRELLEAPRLRQLQLIRKIHVNADDVEGIINHPTIKQFDWFSEDVPEKIWAPVVQKIGLPPVPYDYPEEWFSLRASSMDELTRNETDR
jgi:hypothetical protein